MSIGTLKEGPLHASLKDYYSTNLSKKEVGIGKFVVDILSDDIIYEIQTSSFSGLNRKLNYLLKENQVVLVHPIAVSSIIAKKENDHTKKVTYRRSPKTGDFSDIIKELVYIPKLIDNPRFSIEIILIEERINRVFDSKLRRKRGGWRTINRELTNIIETKRISSSEDIFKLFNIELPNSFDTKELSILMQKPLDLGQKLAYCLREAKITKIIGKKGNSIIYSKVN